MGKPSWRIYSQNSRNITLIPLILLVPSHLSLLAICPRLHSADNSVHAAVFSLSLMNTNYGDSLLEASRILRPGGRTYIAEVESRFDKEYPGSIYCNHGQNRLHTHSHRHQASNIHFDGIYTEAINPTTKIIHHKLAKIETVHLQKTLRLPFIFRF